MDLNHSEFDALEKEIDKALREERMHPSPEGFGQRLAVRLRVAVLIKEEQRRFRRHVLAAGMLGVLLVASGGLAASLMGLSDWMVLRAPGAMGYVDYLTVATARAGWDAMNSVILLLLGSFAVMAVAAYSLLRVWRTA